MQKERINEIKKGLENDIYTKIKDIDVEKKKLGKFESQDSEYESTDFLADILPKKNELANETVQIIDKNSVNLELDREEVLKKYDDYLHNEPKEKIEEEPKVEPLNTMEKESVTQSANDMEDTENMAKIKAALLDDAPSIPKYQTEEHLKVIEEDIKNVEMRYLEEEKEKFEEIQSKLSTESAEDELEKNIKDIKEIEEKDEEIGVESQTNIDVSLKDPSVSLEKPDELILDPTIEEEDIEDDYFDEELPVYKSDTLDNEETKVVYNEEVQGMNDIEDVHLELSNDFAREDSMKLPEVDDNVSNSVNNIENSQFIFEQDLEDDDIYEDEEDYEEADEEEEIFGDGYVDTKNPLQEDNDIDEDDDFWDDEDEEYEGKGRRFVDFILVVVVLLLIYIVLKMTNIL